MTNVQKEDGEPSEKFLTEVRSYFKQQKIKNPANRDKRHTSDGELVAFRLTYMSEMYTYVVLFPAALNHGDTVALQTYVRNYWLSCSQPSCFRHPCPRMFITGNDWTRCVGEVFQIY